MQFSAANQAGSSSAMLIPSRHVTTGEQWRYVDTFAQGLVGTMALTALK
jgi:hypothetical protein